jgi:hypothetical protein
MGKPGKVVMRIPVQLHEGMEDVDTPAAVSL